MAEASGGIPAAAARCGIKCSDPAAAKRLSQKKLSSDASRWIF